MIRLRLRIKEMIEEKGLDMSKLSRKSDVSFTTIQRLCHNPYRPINTSILEKLVNALDVSIHDLIEDVEGPGGEQ